MWETSLAVMLRESSVYHPIRCPSLYVQEPWWDLLYYSVLHAPHTYVVSAIIKCPYYSSNPRHAVFWAESETW